MFDASKNANLIDRILFLFFREVVEANFFQSVNLIVSDSFNFVYLTVSSITFTRIKIFIQIYYQVSRQV